MTKVRKLLVMAAGPLARRWRRRSLPAVRPPLIMTLLVKNEADIVDQNLRFHLAMGVDHVIATDNGSTDGTLEILQEHQRQGTLTLIEEPAQNYAQAAWVNRMADRAFEAFGSCLIFHCDADEFWRSRSGNLKNELSLYPLVACLDVNIQNVMLRFRGYEERFPDDAVLRVHRPLPATHVQRDSLARAFYLFAYPNKVFYRARGHMPHVTDGNHRLVGQTRYLCRPSTDIEVAHIPLRGLEQFRRKVSQGGSAVASNPDLPPQMAWHWRRWYQDLQDGRLEQTYRKLVLDGAEAALVAAEGLLVVDESLTQRFWPQPRPTD